MVVTIRPDAVDARKAAIVAGNTVALANYPPSDARHEPVLRELVGSWVAADCNFNGWRRAHPEFADRLAREARRFALGFLGGRGGLVLPVISSEAPVGTMEKVTVAEYLGYHHFAVFLLAAAPRLVIGECRNCGRFFWNRQGRLNKLTCSRACSLRSSSAERSRRSHAEIVRAKNARVQKALEAYSRLRRRPAGWKAWVCRRARVSQTFLTRTVNRGQVGKPDGVKLPASLVLEETKP
jgi:hypothetical protein